MAEVLGECPAPRKMEFDGLNHGVGAGRACWMVPGTNCGNGSVRWHRTSSCLDCEFYHRVVFEEEEACFTFTTTPASTREHVPDVHHRSLLTLKR